MGLCERCGKQTSTVCARCGSAFYCSKECQREDYVAHRRSCRRPSDVGVEFPDYELSRSRAYDTAELARMDAVPQQVADELGPDTNVIAIDSAASAFRVLAGSPVRVFATARGIAVLLNDDAPLRRPHDFPRDWSVGLHQLMVPAAWKFAADVRDLRNARERARSRSPARRLRPAVVMPGSDVVITAGMAMPETTAQLPAHVPTPGEWFDWEWPGGGHRDYQVVSVTVHCDAGGAARVTSMTARSPEHPEAHTFEFSQLASTWEHQDGTTMEDDAIVWTH